MNMRLFNMILTGLIALLLALMGQFTASGIFYFIMVFENSDAYHK